MLIDAFTTDVATLTGAPPAGESLARDLLQRYTEPHRHYHDTRHLSEVLDHITTLAGNAPPAAVAEVRLAGWFHDAIYDATRADNEAASADLVRTSLTRLGVPEGAVQRIADLVLETTEHALPQGDSSAWLHDADLWILAAPAARFDEYCADVRAEYAHVPDQLYAAGRSAILAPLATRERLYATDYAHREWTTPAHTNLARELARLTGTTADPE